MQFWCVNCFLFDIALATIFWHESLQIAPLHDPVTWHEIHYAGRQVKRKDGLSWYKFLCFRGYAALFASQLNLFRTIWLDPVKGSWSNINLGPSYVNLTIKVRKYVMYYLLIQILASDSTLRLIAISLLRMAKNDHSHQATLANDH